MLTGLTRGEFYRFKGGSEYPRTYGASETLTLDRRMATGIPP